METENLASNEKENFAENSLFPEQEEEGNQENFAQQTAVPEDQGVEKSKKSKRIAAFDIAKGIGILLVVFAHVNYTQASLIYIYSFHMPLFFLISGIFFDKNKYTFTQFVKNRFLRLLCPYLFFYVITLLAYVAMNFLTYGLSPELWAETKEPLVQMFIAQNSSVVVSAPLWFVPCLFVVEVLYYVISKLKIGYVIPACLLLVVGGYLLETEFTTLQPYLPWSVDSALFAIGFYAIGNLTAPFIKKGIQLLKEHKYKLAISLSGALVCFAILIPLAFWNGKISLGSKILNNGVLLYLTGVIGTAGVLFLSVALEGVKPLVYLGKNTFCIMAVHYTIRTFMIKVFEKLDFGYDMTNMLHTALPFVAVLGASIVCVMIYNYAKDLFFKKIKAKGQKECKSC